MGYVGRGLNQDGGQYRKLDSIASSFDGSEVNFNLTIDGLEVTPTAQNLMISLGGVIQEPGSAFSVSGGTITFASAPEENTTFFGVLMGEATFIARGTVGAAEMGTTAGEVTGSKGLVVDSSKNIQGFNEVSATKFDGIFDGALSSSAQIADDISGSVAEPSGNVSGSSTSTGSFGKVEVGGGKITTAGNMVLDADGAQIRLEDGGTEFGRISRVSSDLVIKSISNNNDILFKGVDGSSTITALTLDMSEAGDATFNSGINATTGTISGDFTVGGTLTAQEIHTEFESASIIFTSGSTIFGDTSDDIHNMTGSLNVSGAINLNNGDLIVTDNIGIGTDSPDSQLHVVGAGSPSIRVTDTTNTVTGKFQADNSVGKIGTQTNHSFELFTNNTTALTINNSQNAELVGDLLITDNSDTPLTFKKTSNGEMFIRFLDQDSTLKGALIYRTDTNGFSLRTDGTTALSIDSGQNASFASALTSSLLLVEGVSNYTGIEVKGSGASRPQVKFTNVNQGTLGQIYGTEGNDLSIIAADDLILDATGEHIHIDDGGTRIGNIDMGSQNLTFRASVQDKDIIFRGQDGSSEIEAMRIDFSAAGAVGIGTDAPDSPLHVYGNSADLFRVQTDGVGVGDVNPGTYAQFHVRGAGDTSVTGSEFFDGYGDDTFAGNPLSHTMCLQSTTTATRYMGPSLIFRTKVGNTLNTGTVAAIVGSLDETPGSGVENKGALRFFTCREYNYGPEFGSKMREAMYIDYAGRVGIGTNNLGANLHVRTPYAGSVASVKIDGDDGTNDAGGMLTLAYDTTAKWNILSRNQTSVGSAFALQIQDADGNDGVYMNQNATSFTSNSDERMKENIVELENATDKLNTLRCVNFTMKHDSSGEKRIGLIAQDVYKVYPEVTTGSPDVEYSYNSATTGSSHINAMGLQYTELVAPMIKAIQELSSQIGVLKAQISGSDDFSALKTSVSGSN